MASTSSEQNGPSSIGERSNGQPVGVLHELSTLATISNPAARQEIMGIHMGRRWQWAWGSKT
jgi:hypothetical protein